MTATKRGIKSGIRLTLLAGAALFGALLIFGPGAPAPSASAAQAFGQCSNVDNTGGLTVACDVTITNKLNVATGKTSSVAVVKECHGAANTTPLCTTTTKPSTQLISSVTQCNGAGNGAGATVNCNVRVLNVITGSTTRSAATVNQCIGSGTGGGTDPTFVCNPVGSTTGATITQCNGSGNGGGGAMRVKCDVLTSTRTSSIPVTVNQCNGSGNGGGSTVTCTVQISNRIIAAADASSGSGGSGSGGSTGTGVSTGAAAGGGGVGAGASGDELAHTGVDIGGWGAAASLTIAAGIVLSVLAARRKRVRTP